MPTQVKQPLNIFSLIAQIKRIYQLEDQNDRNLEPLLIFAIL